MMCIPSSKLTGMELGHLSPEESLKLLNEIEKSEELSQELELVVEITSFSGCQDAKSC